MPRKKKKKSGLFPHAGKLETKTRKLRFIHGRKHINKHKNTFK